MILTVSLTIYLLSIIISWVGVRKDHSKNGKHYGTDPTIGDFTITFCPVLNTIDAFIHLIASINFAKFYNIKK